MGAELRLGVQGLTRRAHLSLSEHKGRGSGT